MTNTYIVTSKPCNLTAYYFRSGVSIEQRPILISITGARPGHCSFSFYGTSGPNLQNWNPLHRACSACIQSYYNIWLSMHTKDTMALKDKLPVVLVEFMSEHIVAHKTTNKIFAMTMDQRCEQKSAKVKCYGRSIGLTGNL